MISAAFLLTSLIVVLIPGTGVIYTVSTGLALGRRAVFFAALGCTAGIVPHLLATVLGLAALLHTSAVAFQTLKFSGVLYLLYLAWSMWRDKTPLVVTRSAESSGGWTIATKAVLLNFLNPKLSVFFLAFLPQFVARDTASPLAQMLLLSGVFMAMTFVVFLVYGVLAGSLRVFVIESARVQRWLKRGFALTFTGLAARLALSER